MKLGELLDAFFAIPYSVRVERTRLKKAYLRYRQGDTAMRRYVTMDDLMFEDYRKIRMMSDETRIECMESKLNSVALQAMAE